ncbi:transmembrane protein 11, mitochondrial-like [Mercenaria mercenaria]|uniref:transmembrane protein 11, mitochondrial-like n=1 Tax=Mercenaria mercenaria TaxID=6596 RepID=UPI00234F217C|nr:transmembrane protein 11, mitochondrial-like [Mercenaria mercenaria]
MAVTTASSRPGGPPEYVVIREQDTEEFTDEDFEMELDRALDVHAEFIVIEPRNLGDETARWIKVGNCLHKTSVVTGFVSGVVQYMDSSRNFVIISCGVLSVFCASIYAVSWQYDPCCKYQVEDNLPKLEKILGSLSTVTPVVLVRRDDTRRKKLHNIIAIISGIICAYRFYKWIKS